VGGDAFLLPVGGDIEAADVSCQRQDVDSDARHTAYSKRKQEPGRLISMPPRAKQPSSQHEKRDKPSDKLSAGTARSICISYRNHC